MSVTTSPREDEPTQEVPIVAPEDYQAAPHEVDEEPTGPSDFAEDEDTNVDPDFPVGAFDDEPARR